MAQQDIINAYEAKLGRRPDARELDSEIEQDAKYGHQRLLDELDRRAAPTASNGGRGGDADLDYDGQLDPGWVRNPNPGEGKSVMRASQVPGLAPTSFRQASTVPTLGDLASIGTAPRRPTPPGGMGLPGSRLPPIGTGLPPGVPPGSIPVNAGINPNAWAYQTPDGRIIRGMRNAGSGTLTDLAQLQPLRY